jgi:hypothetical protein
MLWQAEQLQRDLIRYVIDDAAPALDLAELREPGDRTGPKRCLRPEFFCVGCDCTTTPIMTRV